MTASTDIPKDPIKVQSWLDLAAEAEKLVAGTKHESRRDSKLLQLLHQFHEQGQKLMHQQRELEQTKREAERALQSKSEFLSRMCHDIRAPLHALLALTDLIERTEEAESRQQYIALMKFSGESLLNLVDDMLTLSQVEHSGLQLKYRNFDPVQLVDDCTSVFQLQTEEKNIQLKSHIDWPQGVQISGDDHRLRQILNNLLSNAVKFTEQGVVDLRLSGQAKGRQVHMRLTVEDSGPGIPIEKQKDIFQSFVQIPNEPSTRPSSKANDSQLKKPATMQTGFGLGLSICQKIVTLMGGEIKLKSELGKGSQFTVLLDFPIADKSKLSQHVTKPSNKAPINFPRRLLVVDDEPLSRMIMRDYLASFHEIEVVECEGGAQAIELIQEQADAQSIDCICMDMIMPGLDGYETTRRIRQFYRAQSDGYQPFIIAISASSLIEDVDRAIAAGCDKHLGKPFSRQQLLQALTELAPTAPP